jgi:hypothetical protein
VRILSESDEKEKLEKVNKIRLKTEALSAECQRRVMVAYEKSAGWMIEKIQYEREKLKDKNKAFYLIGIMQRLTELRVHVLMEYFPNLQKTESGVSVLQLSDSQKESLKPILRLMIDYYEKIRSELIELFKTEDQKVPNLPKIETTITDSETILKELNICLGQLSGYTLSKMATMFS